MIKVMQKIEKEKFIYVDEWEPNEEDMLFKHTKGAVILPVSQYYNVPDKESLDYFIITKKSHNSPEMREHCTKYLNYFTKYYDKDKELFSVYCQIKYLIDLEDDSYNKDAFFYDIDKYLLSYSMMYKIILMNRDNYTLSLNYKNKTDPSLQYNNKHGSMMMKISLIMNILIPLIGHFAYKRKLPVNTFILEVFDKIIYMYDEVNLYNKLYETSNSNILRSTKEHPIWNKQDIRGKNTTTHTLDSVNNIILNMIPKYLYNGNLVALNFASISKSIKYQITDIGYEFDFIPLSSSKRDEDNNSEFDKFESYLTKQDEALYLQNKVNCESTMKYLENIYGPFSNDEIQFYINKLSRDGKEIINDFQKELIFNLFYKFFGDPMSIKAINSNDYVKLIIIAKKILQANNMVILPYLISSKINRLVSRKTINKKELSKLERSPYYVYIMNKYKSEKIKKKILSIIATMLSSEFEIIDFNDEELDGKTAEVIPEIIAEEIFMYISLI